MGVSPQTTLLVTPPRLIPYRLFQPFLRIEREECGYPDQLQLYSECQGHITKAKTLLLTDPVTARKLLQKALLSIKKNEYIDLAVEAYDLLHQYCLEVPVNPLLAREYARLKQFYKAQFQAECEIESYYHKLEQEYAEGTDLTLKLEKYYTIGEALLQQFPSYRTRLFTMLIGLKLHACRRNFQATLLLCQISQVAFEQKASMARIPLQIIYYYSLICMVRMRMYGDGEKTAQKALDLAEPGSFNWFKFRQLQVLLCTYTGHYHQACQHIVHSMKHPGFKKLPEDQQENWMIFEVYLLFIKYLQADASSRFKVVNALKRLTRKTGYTTQTPFAHRLAQIFIAFATKKYESLIRLIQILREQEIQYAPLGKPAFLIVEIFEALIDSDFQPEEIQKKERTHLQQLRGSESCRSTLHEQPPVVPVEDLWIKILLVLKAQLIEH